jgi:hypothetical protein
MLTPEDIDYSEPTPEAVTALDIALANFVSAGDREGARKHVMALSNLRLAEMGCSCLALWEMADEMEKFLVLREKVEAIHEKAKWN